MNYFRELSTKTPLDFIPSAPESQNTEYLYKLDVPDVSQSVEPYTFTAATHKII